MVIKVNVLCEVFFNIFLHSYKINGLYTDNRWSRKDMYKYIEHFFRKVFSSINANLGIRFYTF